MTILNLLEILLIPILSILYALGERLDWWDKLTGRKILIDFLNRFNDETNKEDLFIDKDEKGFQKILEYLVKRTRNGGVKRFYKYGGRTIKISLDGTNVTESKESPGWPKKRFIPRETNILIIGDFTLDSDSETKEKANWICTVNELDNWLTNDLEKQRFIVTIVLLSILGVSIGFMNYI